jgi:hypothetical protein
MTDPTQKLEYFLKVKKIPNIVFHGSSGSGKRTILSNFLKRIYSEDRVKMKNNVMLVNCAHGKGIKFIRDELKNFAKANMQCNDNTWFKSIVLYNADELTIDAQSALRRCIELFSNNTRFFIVVENKQKLLKPILSRFCEIYVPDKFENGVFKSWRPLKEYTDITSLLTVVPKTHQECITLCNTMYESGISCLDLVAHLAKGTSFSALQEGLTPSSGTDASILFCFEKVKSEFRNEKLLMMYMLDYAFIRSERDLHNVSFL